MSEQDPKEQCNLAYGNIFKEFSAAEIDDVTRNYEARFGKGIEAENLFKGKKCFDGGCGAGRGSIYMKKYGASSVDGIDLSSLNIETTKRNLSQAGLEMVPKNWTGC